MILLLGIPHVTPLIEEICIFPPQKTPSLYLGSRALPCWWVGKRGKNIFVRALNICSIGKSLILSGEELVQSEGCEGALLTLKRGCVLWDLSWDGFLALLAPWLV